MNLRLLLVKAITLLYKEREVSSEKPQSIELVKEGLDLIKVADGNMNSDFGKDANIQLKETALWMMSQDFAGQFDRVDLIQRIRLCCGSDKALYESIKTGLTEECTELENKVKNISLRSEIKQYVNEQKLQAIFKSAYIKTNFESPDLDWKNFYAEFNEKVVPLLDFNTIEQRHPAIVGSVSFGSIAGVTEAITTAKESVSDEGSLRWGVQAMTRMFGGVGGRRGELWTIAALKHNYKSGLSLDFVRWAALYNTPYMIDKTKKPMILRFSMENNLQQDILQLYKLLYEHEFHVLVDIDKVDPAKASEYVVRRLGVNGYTVELVQINPTDFTIYDLMNEVERYESLGYEIHMLNIDYVAKMSTKGCKQGAQGDDIKDLFSRLRNFVEKKKIFCITPHQLSSAAKQLVRNGQTDLFVKLLPDGGYYMGCSTLDVEPDGEIFIHKIEVNGKFYLTVQRGKHRRLQITDSKYLYWIYPFNPIGGIVDDIHGADMSKRSVSSRSAAEGGGDEWWSGGGGEAITGEARF